MAKIKPSKIKKTGVIVLSVGLIFLLYNIYQFPIIKNKIPWLDNQIRAYKYERMAKKFLPDDLKAKRLRAMAESLRSGSRDYQFETGPLPPMGQ